MTVRTGDHALHGEEQERDERPGPARVEQLYAEWRNPGQAVPEPLQPRSAAQPRLVQAAPELECVRGKEAIPVDNRRMHAQHKRTAHTRTITREHT